MTDSYPAILEDLLKLYPAVKRPRLKESHRRVTHIAHGWYMRTHWDVHAVMLLRQQGLPMQSWPIRRSIIEHVVGLKWLSSEGGHVADLVRRAHAISAERRRDAVVAADWSKADMAIFDEVIADIAATDAHKSFDHLLHFKQRCDKYGTADDFSSYLIETSHSHPSWETASPYFEQGEDGGVALYFDAHFDSSRDDAGFCAMHLWEALAAFGGMMESSPWDEQLAALRERILQMQPG